MDEILKILNRELKRLKADLKEENRLWNDWYRKGIALEKEVRDLKQEKEVLMKRINELTDNK